MSETAIYRRDAADPEPCGYCNNPSRVFYSFNPDVSPDICLDCLTVIVDRAHRDEDTGSYTLGPSD